MPKGLLIGVVGPCGAGKSTLVANLARLGISARHIAQEHSYTPTMWHRITRPDILIYLEVSYDNTIKRRALDWTESEYQEQLHRLRHAIQHADLCVNTNILDQDQVFRTVVGWLEQFPLLSED